MITIGLGYIVAILYGVATASYTIHFIAQKKIWSRLSTILLTGGAVFHALYIVTLARELDRFPLGNVYEFLVVAAFLFTAVYIVLEFHIRDKSMGVIIAPIIFLMLISGLSGVEPGKTLAPQLAGVTFQVHVAFMLLAYSGFAIAFIASTMHLLLAREIHRKRLGFFFSRLPSLELLDRLNSSAATLGFSFATCGMLLGFFMAMELWGNPVPLDAKFISFIIVWGLYLFHLIARHKLGWRGERAARLSVVGFTFIVLTFLVASLIYTKMHLYL